MTIAPEALASKVAQAILDHGEDVTLTTYGDPAWDESYSDSQVVGTDSTVRAVCYDEARRERGPKPVQDSGKRAILSASSVESAPRAGDEITARGARSRILSVRTYQYRGVLAAYELELEG